MQNAEILSLTCCTLAFVKQLLSTAVVVLNRGEGYSVTPRGTCGNIRGQLWLSQRGEGATGLQCIEPRDAAQHLTMHRAGPATRNSPAQDAHSTEAEKLWSTAPLLLQTYHLIHGVTGVVAFWVGASDPHRLKELFLLLLISVRQRLLRLFFLDWAIILLFAGALVVTPSVFFFLPTSSLLLPTWGATSKGGKGG